MASPTFASQHSPPDRTVHPHDTAAEEYENRHVHAVYEEIAPHFSSTRYKPWPIVAAFLQNLRVGSIGLDAGCGNGKYLSVNPNVWIVGSDRSEKLTRIAAAGRRAQSDAIVADSMALPHSGGRFDFAISIAVIHHLSTVERRVQALRVLLEVLKPPLSSDGKDHVRGGKVLVFVWALEQKESRRGWGEGDEQDVMVPWVMKVRKAAKPMVDAQAQGHGKGCESEINNSIPTSGEVTQTFQRYYHLYRQGELERDLVAAGGRVLESGYERDNWWAIAARTTRVQDD